MRVTKEINITIGKGIKTARETAGLTQEEFAELVQMGTKNVSAIERGVAGISVEKLKLICDVLSVSSDSLLFSNKEKLNDVRFLSDQLERLSPEQFRIATHMYNVLLESFTL